MADLGSLSHVPFYIEVDLVYDKFKPVSSVLYETIEKYSMT